MPSMPEEGVAASPVDTKILGSVDKPSSVPSNDVLPPQTDDNVDNVSEITKDSVSSETVTALFASEDTRNQA